MLSVTTPGEKIGRYLVSGAERNVPWQGVFVGLFSLVCNHEDCSLMVSWWVTRSQAVIVLSQLGKFYPCQFWPFSYILLIKMSIHNTYFVAFAFHPKLISHHGSQLSAGTLKLADGARSASCLQMGIEASKVGLTVNNTLGLTTSQTQWRQHIFPITL